MATIINKILFCSDLTKGSVKVFEQAVALALQTGATISMIHAIQDEQEAAYKAEFIDWMSREIYNNVRKKKEEKAKNVLIDKQKGMIEIQNALKKYFEETGKHLEEYKQITVDAIEISEMKPELAIPEFAETNGCDLIVLGYHKRGSFLRGIMESGKNIMQRNNINVFLVFLEE